MKVTVLGEWGGYPEANGATSGYLVEVNGEKILMDCGSGILSSLQNHINLDHLDAVILSHFHHDHICDIYVMHYAMKHLINLGFRQDSLYIYADKSHEKFETLNYYPYCEAKNLKELMERCDIVFDFMQTIHKETCYAVKIKHEGKILIYTGDTSWSDDLVQFSENADLLICESSLFNAEKDSVSGHMTAGEAGLLAKKAGVKKLVLTHFPHAGVIKSMRKEAAESYDGPIVLARKGLEVFID